MRVDFPVKTIVYYFHSVPAIFCGAALSCPVGPIHEPEGET